MILTLLLTACSSSFGAQGNPPLQAGDILFHRSDSRQSEAIARATGSQLTHTGIVLEHEGTLQVFEAVEPVGWESIDDWIARGRGGQVEIRRLADPTQLTAEEIDAMDALARQWTGKHYDAAFSWSDDRIYCSELVYKLHERAADVKLGELRKMRDFKLDDPVVKAMLTERYGTKIPLDEPVTAPSDIADWEGLVRVR